MSCDLVRTMTPGPHYVGNVLNLLDKEEWDLLVAFPPCTYLSNIGNRHMNPERTKARDKAVKFVQALMAANIPRIAIENPVGHLSSAIRKPDQIIHPWWFGHPYSKRTCLWLKGLPLLKPDNVVVPGESYMSTEITKEERDRTFKGIARAMGQQWGSLPCLKHRQYNTDRCPLCSEWKFMTR